MQRNVSSGIVEGMTNLAQVFAPNAGQHIEADLALGKRKLYDAQADAQVAAANARYANADKARTDARLATNKDNRAAEVHENLMGLGGVLTGLDPSTPDGRAGIIGAFGAAGVDLNDPSTIAGYTTMIDPEFAGNPENLGNVFVGTGAVDSYNQTQPGQAQAEEAAHSQAADLARINNEHASTVARINNEHASTVAGADNATERLLTQMNNDAAMDQLRYRTEHGVETSGDTGKQMSPLDVQRAQKEVTALIADMHGGATPDPAIVQSVMALASEYYQKGQGWPQAVNVAMSQHNFEVDNGWFDGAGSVAGTRTGGPMSTPTPAPQPSQTPVGQTATNPETGEKIRWNGQQWVPVQ